ncbi:hypothetical protein FA95DRAFT_1559391 [Auriscalpium vulgare]|uniref:Uncharacterized protein n=1 Tax=Auriscalpium vulgare TaxID=40419 RepID=A0ACB8RSL4_9AGAM|nr:hypothetical protein FA95DRAFT_1559391 [Auriscalpium vulgare]
MDPAPVPATGHGSTAQSAVVVKTEERTKNIALAQAHRQPPRYKDKFQVLRERYDQVNVLHDDYERTLQVAAEKERKLQTEIDMLLDAAAASEVRNELLPYWGPEPTYEQRPSAVYDPAQQQPQPHAYAHPHPPPHAAYANGNGAAVANGNGYAHADPGWRPAAQSEGAVLEYVQVDPTRRAL